MINGLYDLQIAPVVQTFFAEVNSDNTLEEKYKLDAVITVVDAKYILQRLDETKGTEAEQQVCFADKIILNKMVSHEIEPPIRWSCKGLDQD